MKRITSRKSEIGYLLGLLFALLAVLHAGPAQAQGRSQSTKLVNASSESQAADWELMTPLVILIDDVMVPAQAEGMLTQIAVEEGMIVEKGQPIAIIDDRQAKLTQQLKLAELKESKLNAENTVNIRDAKNSLELEREKAIAFQKMAKEQTIAFWEAETQRLEAERQALRFELAEQNQEIAKVQYEAKKYESQLAELEIQKRNVIAPFGGFIEKREAQLGEWVQPGSPIVQLVRMDRLRAQAFFLSSDGNQTVRIGMPAVLEFQLGNGQLTKMNGQIGFVGNDIDLRGQRRVWVEFENQRVGNDWLIKPGMKPVIRINSVN